MTKVYTGAGGIDQEATALAASGAPKLRTQVVKRKLSDLRGLTVNARYMKAHQFNRLKDNIEHDGGLTSVPLIYQGEILSGNHRVKAADKAGIEEIDVMEILNEDLPPERLVALSLSHNAIVGEDDPNTLASLYGNLDLASKLYSGITDEDLSELPDLDLDSLSAGATDYRQIDLVFLPEQEAAFVAVVKELERISKSTKLRRILVARSESFDKFFDTIVAVKEFENVLNAALAVEVMAELAMERILQLVGDEEHGDAGVLSPEEKLRLTSEALKKMAACAEAGDLAGARHIYQWARPRVRLSPDCRMKLDKAIERYAPEASQAAQPGTPAPATPASEIAP